MSDAFDNEAFILISLRIDISKLYNVLLRVSGGIDPLKQRLEEYVVQYASTSIQSLVEKLQNDPKEYITHLLTIYRKFSHLVSGQIWSVEDSLLYVSPLLLI